MSGFKLERVQGQPVSDEELIADLQRVAKIVDTNSLSQRIYSEHGAFAPTTITRRFGTWNKATAKIGLNPANEININDERLFQNVMMLWEHYGRRPRKSELANPPSTISEGAYRRRFASWLTAMSSFVDYANQRDATFYSQETSKNQEKYPKDASLRLRFKVLKRDNFTCLACGASPSRTLGVVLHVDHINPRSSGGETLEANLQTLCEPCNLGKSNVL